MFITSPVFVAAAALVLAVQGAPTVANPTARPNRAAAGAQGGSILLATVDNFPILQDLGISGAISLLFTVIDGILDTGFVQENGFNAEVETQLGKYQATVFPDGQHPLPAEPRPILPPPSGCSHRDVVDAALGFPETIGAGNIAAWKSHLPVNLAAGVESCLQACGLSHGPTFLFNSPRERSV
ncbi:hypothetical protein B0H14DRAFT_3869540, partial [Mycena olivaceomarginata]